MPFEPSADHIQMITVRTYWLCDVTHWTGLMVVCPRHVTWCSSISYTSFIHQPLVSSPTCLTVFNHREQCSCWFMPCVIHWGFLLYAQIKRFQKGSDFCWWSDCFEFLCQRPSIRPSAHECWIRGFGPSVTPFMKGRADCLSYVGHLA